MLNSETKRNIDIDPEWPRVKLEEVLDYEQPNDYIVSSTNYDDNFKTKRYWISKYQNLEIYLPNLETQQQIVSEIEKERELVESNKKLVEVYENKIKSVIQKIWGVKI